MVTIHQLQKKFNQLNLNILTTRDTKNSQGAQSARKMLLSCKTRPCVLCGFSLCTLW